MASRLGIHAHRGSKSSGKSAETDEKAEEIALSTMVWNLKQDGQADGELTIPSIEEAKRYQFSAKDEERLAKMRRNMIIGSPTTVKKQLESIQSMYEAEELMIVTITHQKVDKFQSYRLLKGILG